MGGRRLPVGPGGPLVILGLLAGLCACVDLDRPAGLATVSTQNYDALPAVDRGPDRPADAGDAPGEPGPEAAAGGAEATDTGLVEGGPGPEVIPPPGPPGAACASGADCAGGICVDGVCCAEACDQKCQACNLPGKTGTCTPVPEGQDPANECDENPVEMCRQDGTCDGRGACRNYPVGTQCAAGRCQGATEYAASTCAGVGVCQAGSSRSCAPNTCADSGCRASCSTSAECQAGFFCDDGSCKAKAAAGAACSNATQCGSGFCVDGVCCAVACGGLCQACNLPGKLGMCTPVASGSDPAQECAADPAGSCGKIGGCDGRGGCRLEVAGVACGAPASCSGATATSARSCNGAGVCQAATSSSCGAYLCSGAACATSCASASACQPAHKCASAACLPLKIGGLTVHDTARAASWGVRLDFRIGSAGARPWAEWPNSYITGVDPAGSVLLGNEWTAVATDSKEYTAGPQATLTLSAGADVYLMVDDRWGASPSWTAGFTNTGWNITVFESSSRPALPFSVYRRTEPGAATLSLPRIGATTAYNYFVVVH